MKMNYNIKDLPTTGPGSKWLVTQKDVPHTGQVITWKIELNKNGYIFMDSETNCSWSRAQVRLATPKEIKNNFYKKRK